MAASPRFKVYRGGEYVAACKYAEDAALLATTDDAEIRLGHSRVIWREGAEEISASDSFDRAAEIMHARIAR